MLLAWYLTISGISAWNHSCRVWKSKSSQFLISILFCSNISRGIVPSFQIQPSICLAQASGCAVATIQFRVLWPFELTINLACHMCSCRTVYLYPAPKCTQLSITDNQEGLLATDVVDSSCDASETRSMVDRVKGVSRPRSFARQI